MPYVSGAEALNGNDPELVAWLRDEALAQAQRAREDPIEFIEFVIRRFDKPSHPITLAAHQKVMVQFFRDHDRAALMAAVGSAKTFCALGYELWKIGNDPDYRGAVLSATETQASKLVDLMRLYIEESVEFRLVFPNCFRSRRVGDPWTHTQFTVNRRKGIKDPTMLAVGLDSKTIVGSRLSDIWLDDTLNDENTRTKEQRENVTRLLDLQVKSRLDERNPKAQVLFTNSPWHPDDAIHECEKRGWATMRMDILGDITVFDDSESRKPWDSALLRPKDSSSAVCRLVDHGPDPDNVIPLWPEERPMEWIEKVRREHLPQRFNQLYRAICRDDGSSMCKQSYVDLCLQKARELGVYYFTSGYDGPNPTFTGVDLAVSPGEESDDTAFFTFEARPDGMRIILDIEVGKWSGPDIVEKIFDKHNRYKSIIRVENNFCFVPGTNVLTKGRGYVPIETVKVGDLVWTHLRRWKPVRKVLSGKSRMIHEARIVGNPSLMATPNHWFRLREAARTSGRGGGHIRPFGEPDWVSVGFVNRPAFAEIAVPKWDAKEPKLIVPKSRRDLGRVLDIDEHDALALGLYMAEGHTSGNQVHWTLSWSEEHLAELAECFAKKAAPQAKCSWRNGEGTIRVTSSSAAFANSLREIGKSNQKCLPLEWLGWPLHLRIAVVRGWLMGDGFLGTNNRNTKWPGRFFSGCSISRNWIMWARTTLLEAGYRPRIWCDDTDRESLFGDRRVEHRHPIWSLSLNADDSARLRSVMTSKYENKHWPSVIHSGKRKSGSSLVHDEKGVWAKLCNKPGECKKYEGVVYNLEVEDDESFTAEDVVVHNAQDFIRQFAIAKDISLPIKAHTTGRVKAHPEHGVPALFVEMSNGAWAFPNTKTGALQPAMRRFVDECLNYTPSKHTGDVLMSCYFAREQAKKFGCVAGRKQSAGSGLAGIASFTAR